MEYVVERNAMQYKKLEKIILFFSRDSQLQLCNYEKTHGFMVT